MLPYIVHVVLYNIGFKYIYMVNMVCFKARQHFQDSNGKIDFFTEAGTKQLCSFILKEKMFLSDQGTNYLGIH